MMKVLVLGTALVIMLGCGVVDEGGDEALDSIAEDYVRLVLEMGEHFEHYVDFYFGPGELMPAGPGTNTDGEPPLGEYLGRAVVLVGELDDIEMESLDEELRQRHRFLRAHLVAVRTKLEMETGATYDFDEEYRRLFGADAPSYDTAFLESGIRELDLLLDGEGELGDRYYDYVWRFVIPEDKLGEVYQTAIDEAKSRTVGHLDLYEDDRCVLELVTDKPWDAFNSYERHGYSRVQINTGYRKQIKSARDAACHECYPGHHVHSSLWEKDLYEGRGWVEFSVGVTSSPSYLIYEGIAEYAVETAFAEDGWTAFDRDALFAVAGLDPLEAERYNRVIELYKTIQWASVIEGSRGYLDGDLDREQAITFFMTYTLRTRPEAEGLLSAVDLYRSYLVNYLFGAQMVRSYVERMGGTPDDPDRRWELVGQIMSSPVLPADLLPGG